LTVLDTDVLIEMIDKKSSIGENWFRRLDEMVIATTVINMHEMASGFFRIGRPLPDELKSLQILPFNPEDALLSSRIESQLEREGNSVGRFDSMIAAICINNGTQLATLNTRHFRRMEGFGLRIFE